MRLLIPLILLAFPFAEIFVLVKLAHQYGWWLLLYLVVIGYLGLQLIKGEKILMGPKMMQTLNAGGNPIKAMLGTARNMIAGVLLLIPGVITDVIAVVLLLIPMQQTAAATTGQTHGNTKEQSDIDDSSDYEYQRQDSNQEPSASDGDVIEGEYTHIKDDQGK